MQLIIFDIMSANKSEGDEEMARLSWEENVNENENKRSKGKIQYTMYHSLLPLGCAWCETHFIR